jgi:hypothetical protein
MGRKAGGYQFKDIQPGQKVGKTLSQRTTQDWWHIALIPATWEVHSGG